MKQKPMGHDTWQFWGVEARKYHGSNITIQKQKTGIEARPWDLTDLTNKILWFVHQQDWNT